MRRRLRLNRSQRGWPIAAGALALALLLAQTLGLLHGIAHGDDARPVIAVHAHDDAAPSDEGHEGHEAHEAHAPNIHIAGLFDTHEDDSSECQLYDQLTHADLLWSALAPLTAGAPPAVQVRRAEPPRRAVTASWFRARAPPQRT